MRYFCSPHHQDSALFPFIGQLERAAGFARDDAPSAKLDKLEALLAPNAPAECDVPLLAELLSLPFDNRYPALDFTPQRKKEETFDALLRQFAGLARRQPVLMIFEDLHWADPTSRELLGLWVEHVARMPVLLLATFRPEFRPPWTGQPHVETLPLRRLGREESGELVRGPRRSLHARIALALEERFPDVARTWPETVAHHFTGAGLFEKAAGYWCRAGRQSVAKSGFTEAIAQLRTGLRLIADLPDTRERKQQEVELQVTLIGVLQVIKGYAHPEVAASCTRARRLILETGRAGTSTHFLVLRALWSADIVGGKPRAALDHASEFLSLAQSQADPRLRAMGHWLVGRVLTAIGDYPAAISHLETAVASYRAEKNSTQIWVLPISGSSRSPSGDWHSGIGAAPIRHAGRPTRHCSGLDNSATPLLSPMRFSSSALPRSRRGKPPKRNGWRMS